MKNEKIVGIDIGGTNFRIGVVDTEGKVKHFRKVSVSDIFVSEDPLTDLTDCIRKYIQETGSDISTVSIGFPATLNRERTRIIQAPNISFLENLPVVSVLSKELDTTVYLERDVNMLLSFDIKEYQLPSEGIICGIYFGTGIGNAICIDGRLLSGKNGVAGELGHIPSDGSYIPCGCGNTGCMENLAGGKYLAHLQQTCFPDISIHEIFLVCREQPQIRQFINRMAETVATEVNILDPDYVLIGGGVPQMEGFPVEELTQKILAYTRKPYPAENLQIIYTEDIPEKGVIGAAYYARQKQTAL